MEKRVSRMGCVEKVNMVSWTDRRVMITGATGFLGSWMTKALIDKGAEVVVFIRDIRPKLPAYLSEAMEDLSAIVYGDLADYPLVERMLNEYEVDSCFHLAAQAIVGVANRSPLSTFESNIKGTWNVLEAARNSKNLERLVIASSDKAYGSHPNLPYKEDYPLNGRHPYDASKACADILAQTYYETYKVPLAIARCANLYGGGDLNFSRLVPDTMRSVIFNRNPVIRSDGSPIRDYMYVEDAVNAYLTLGEALGEKGVIGEAFNFGTGNPVSVLELVKKVIGISGKRLRPDIRGKGKTWGEIDKQYLSIEKARERLRWAPKYELDRGLRKTYHWYETFLL
jgi:CDP-glucose 4,6-dehydratase